MIEHRASTSSVVGKTVNKLDSTGRLVTTEIDLDGDGRFEQTVNREYDDAGRLVATRQTDSTLRFVRDRDGRVVRREIEDRSGRVERTTITYDDHGRMVRELSDLDDVHYRYDRAGCQVREQRYRLGDEVPFIDLAASCDQRGHRVSRQGDDGSGPIRQTWRYDERGHMVQDDLSRDGVLVLDTRVSYDAAGRRLAEDYRDAKGVLTGRRTWTYNADGDVLSDQVDDLDEGSWIRDTYLYDGSGDRCPSQQR